MANREIKTKVAIDGEKEYKESLKNINSALGTLKSELKLVESQYAGQANSYAALSAKGDVLSRMYDQQKEKVKAAAEQLEKAKKAQSDYADKMASAQSEISRCESALAALGNKTGDTSEEQKKLTEELERAKNELADAERGYDATGRSVNSYQTQVNNAETELNKLGSEIDKNNGYLEEAEKSSDGCAKSIDEYGKEVKEASEETSDFSDKLKNGLVTGAKAAAAAVAAVATAAVATGKAVWDAANKTAEAGDAIDKTSQKIGISAEAYQEWSYVFERSGANVDNLQTGMKKLSGVITDAASGSASAAEKLSAVGLSIDELNGKSQEQQLQLVISALQDMGSGAERTAAANDLLGKSAVDMAAVLNMTAEDTEALKQEARDYGMIMSNEAVAASAAFEDSLTRLNNTMTGVKNGMVGELLPGITEIMDGLADLIAGNDEAGEKIESGVTSVIQTISGSIPKVVNLISTIAAAVLKSAPSIIGALADGILSSLPEITSVVTEIVTELVAGLVTLLPQVAEAGAQMLAGLVQGIGEALPTLIPAAVEAVTQLVQALVDNVPLLIDAALQLVQGLAEGVLEAIPVLLEALPELIESLVTTLLDAIPQIIETGVELLTALVENLPEIITTICEVLPQIIESTITTLLDHLPEIVEAGVKLLTALITNLPQIILTIVQALPQIITAVINALVNNIPKIIETGVKLLTALITNLPQIIAEIVRAMPQIITGIVNALGEGVSQVAEVGANLVRGLWDGIQSLAGWLWDKVSGWISSIWDGITDFFGIHSPSTQMAWVGEMLVEGLAGAVDKDGKKAVNAIGGMSEQMLDEVDSGLAAVNARLASQIGEIETGFSAKATVEAVSASVPADLTGRGGGAVASGGGDTNVVNHFHIAELAVREEADVKKIARELYNMQKSKTRSKGVSMA